MIELKPCPFCGGKSIELWPMHGFASPVCMNCGATIAEAISTGESTEKQIMAWNTRYNEKERAQPNKIKLSIYNLDRFRQWFNSIQDVNPEYLDKYDYEIAKMIYEELGWRIPDSIKEKISNEKENQTRTAKE